MSRALVVWAVALVALGCGGASPRPAGPPAPLSAQAYSQYLRGRLAHLEGDPARAVSHFRAAARAAPAEAAVRVALIRALLDAGRDDEARREAETARARWPHEPAVWLVSGDAYRAASMSRQTAELERAARAYERARSLAPGRQAAYLRLAATCAALGRPECERAAYRVLLAVAPGSVAGHHGLARALLRDQAHARAEHHLRRALELDRDHVQARTDLARVLRATGRERESIDTLRQAFDRSGGDLAVAQALFRQLLDAGERDLAVALLGVLDRADLDDDTKIGFGYLYLDIGEHEAAGAQARWLRARNRGGDPARLLEATALASAHQLDAAIEALDVLDDAPSQGPDAGAACPDCLALAAELLARRGRQGRARALLARGLPAHPDHAALVIARARVHELAGQPRRSRALFREALASRPVHAELLYAYGAFEHRQGHPRRAVAIVQTILDRDPDHAGALNFIGFSLADRHVLLSRAQRLLKRALELAPGNAFVLDSYGWLLFRRGRLDQARAVLERAVHMHPRAPALLWHLGEVVLAQGDRDRARALFATARTLHPEPRLGARINARIRGLAPARGTDK